MAVLIIIWLSYAYRLGYYIWYQTPGHMCEFLYEHPKWFATVQAFVDIIGEAVPLMVVFTMQMLKVCSNKKRKSKKYIDPNDTLNSHADLYESRDMGPGLQGVGSEDASNVQVGSEDYTQQSVLKI